MSSFRALDGVRVLDLTQHNAEVYGALLGLGRDEVAQLERDRVI